MLSSSISFLSGGLGDFGVVIGAIMVVKHWPDFMCSNWLLFRR